MNNIKIKKSGGLFKFFKFMNKTPVGSIYIDYCKYDNSINSFNDICTFVRHFLITIFIAIPVQLLIIGLVLWWGGFALIYLPVITIMDMFNNTGTNFTPIGLGVLYSYISIIASYIILCALQQLRKNVNIEPIKFKEDGAIKTAFTIISQKHSKFCQRIETVDDEK